MLEDLETTFIAGDFNEPSHRDWTKQAVALGVQPSRVAFPATLRLEKVDFVDTCRAAFPSEINNPGFTWTPNTAADDPNDHHDRIGYVFLRAVGARVLSAAIAGEASTHSSIEFTDWPSDHCAVIVEVAIP